MKHGKKHVIHTTGETNRRSAVATIIAANARTQAPSVEYFRTNHQIPGSSTYIWISYGRLHIGPLIGCPGAKFWVNVKFRMMSIEGSHSKRASGSHGMRQSNVTAMHNILSG